MSSVLYLNYYHIDWRQDIEWDVFFHKCIPIQAFVMVGIEGIERLYLQALTPAALTMSYIPVTTISHLIYYAYGFKGNLKRIDEWFPNHYKFVRQIGNWVRNFWWRNLELNQRPQRFLTESLCSFSELFPHKIWNRMYYITVCRCLYKKNCCNKLFFQNIDRINLRPMSLPVKPPASFFLILQRNGLSGEVLRI